MVASTVGGGAQLTRADLPVPRRSRQVETEFWRQTREIVGREVGIERRPGRLCSNSGGPSLPRTVPAGPLLQRPFLSVPSAVSCAVEDWLYNSLHEPHSLWWGWRGVSGCGVGLSLAAVTLPTAGVAFFEPARWRWEWFVEGRGGRWGGRWDAGVWRPDCREWTIRALPQILWPLSVHKPLSSKPWRRSLNWCRMHGGRRALVLWVKDLGVLELGARRCRCLIAAAAVLVAAVAARREGGWTCRLRRWVGPRM